MNQASKRYAREFILPMIVYGIVIILSRLTLNSISESPWRFAIALLPLIPVLFLIAGYGFLELEGFPPFSTFFIFPLMIMLWGVGLAYFSRRYE